MGSPAPTQMEGWLDIGVSSRSFHFRACLFCWAISIHVLGVHPCRSLALRLADLALTLHCPCRAGSWNDQWVGLSLAGIDSFSRVWFIIRFMSTLREKRTYFGLAALIIGGISVLDLAARFAVAYMDIAPRTFGILNQITTLFFCILTPLAFVLAVLGWRRKNDSRSQAGIALALVLLPFAGLLLQFILNFFIQ